MKSRGLTLAGLVSALVMCASLLAACGEEDEKATPEGKVPKLASAAVIDGDPYAIACGHVRDQQKWADATRQATVAIAQNEQLPKLNDLQASQSIFFAFTELCKGRPATFEPAEAAVRAVRAGKYRAEL